MRLAAFLVRQLRHRSMRCQWPTAAHQPTPHGCLDAGGSDRTDHLSRTGTPRNRPVSPLPRTAVGSSGSGRESSFRTSFLEAALGHPAAASAETGVYTTAEGSLRCVIRSFLERRLQKSPGRVLSFSAGCDSPVDCGRNLSAFKSTRRVRVTEREPRSPPEILEWRGAGVAAEGESPFLSPRRS